MILVLLLGVLTLSAQPKVSVHLQQVPLQEVFSAIEAQTNYPFFYNSNEINTSTPVSLNVDQVTIREAIAKVLPGVDCSVEGGRIVLTRKNAQGPSAASTRETVLRGTVRDADGQPLTGASVVLTSAGEKYGVTADLDGRFELKLAAAPKPGDPVCFSYMGFVEKTLPVEAGPVFDIVLQEDNDILSESVVVGYGIQRKVNLTGSVSSVKDDDLVRRPVMRATTALQGLAAGVTVTQSSGQPGSDGATIRIHGIGTLNDSNPLVLIDGVSGNLDAVNPNDIESISILKDAASAAIYGSRAANGVVLVTTKGGAADRITTTYNGYVGVQRAVALPEFTSNYDYMLGMNRAYDNVGMTPLYSESYLNDWLRYKRVDPDHYPDLDWQDAFLDGSGLTQNHYFSVRGGGSRFRAFASVAYQTQAGIFSGYDSDRISARANVTTQVTDYLDFSLLLDGRRSRTNAPTYGESFILGYINRIPGLYTLVLSDGRYGAGYNNRNPLALSRLGGNSGSTTDAFRGTVSASFHPLKSLRFDLKFTPSLSNTYKKVSKTTVDFYSPDQEAPIASAPATSSLSQTDAKTTQTTLQALVNYQKRFGKKHDFSALGGYEQFHYQTQSIGLSREGFTLPEYQVMDAGSTLKMDNEGTASEWALVSFFGRLNYSYAERYLAEVNFRADGSSRFSPGHKWGFFPSFSLGWRISEEPFFQGNKLISNLKLRASWGRLGNQSIGTYPAYETIALNSVYAFNSLPADGGYQSAFANEGITWETTENWNAGLDFAFFSNRLSGSFDFYHKKTYDILLQLPIQDISGLKAPYQNAGTVQNNGWDFEIAYKGGVRDFRYDVSFNLSDVYNKILDLKGMDPIRSGYTIKTVGQPINALYGYKADGLYRNSDDLYGGPDQTYFGSYGLGDIRYVNMTDEDKTVNVINAYDRTVLGNQIPRLNYGLTLSAGWKGFDASVFLQGTGKRDIILTGDCVWALYNGGKMQTWMTDNWTPDNPDASYPRLIAASSHNNFQYSSFWVYNAAFLRVKTVQLGYTVPEKATRAVRIETLRFYLTADNLLTLSGLPKGWDPEMGSGGADIYPLIKTFLGGIQITF